MSTMGIRCVVLMGCLGWLPAVAEDQPNTPKSVAGAYFSAWMAGKPEEVMELSTIPFFLGPQGMSFTMMDRLSEKMAEILAKNGQRDVPPHKVEELKDAEKLDPDLFPEHEVFRITLADGGKPMDIFVTSADAPKVIGYKQ